eukprot:SAG31_NODE_32420_length_356_cov_0.785992_1_plen_49_part_10
MELNSTRLDGPWIPSCTGTKFSTSKYILKHVQLFILNLVVSNPYAGGTF